MPAFKDYFSRQAAAYSRYRPAYPPELLAYVASLAQSRGLAVDCATGSGQAAVALAAPGRLALTQGGNVRYRLKTPYRDGTTHVIFEPEDLIVRLAALVPRPRAHLTRYHGVFAPASRDRARIVPKTARLLPTIAARPPAGNRR